VIFQVRSLLLFFIVLHLQKLLLGLLVQLEQCLNLSVILLQQSVSLAHELRLNFL
jgi:hypothetical protein